MALEKFHYPATDDPNAIVIPRIDQLPAGIIRKNRGLNEDEQAWALVEAAADAKNLTRIDKLTIREFADFMQKWQASGEITPGE